MLKEDGRLSFLATTIIFSLKNRGTKTNISKLINIQANSVERLQKNILAFVFCLCFPPFFDQGLNSI